MDVYLIIGDKNTGKSSLIRCLTGCAQHGRGNFALTNGKTLSAYVVISALQKYSVQFWQNSSSFIQYVQNDSKAKIIDKNLIPAVLVPLWEHSGNAYPAASQYITAFENKKLTIVKTALLDSQTPVSNYPNCQVFSGVKNKPINITAAAVRQHFEWI